MKPKSFLFILRDVALEKPKFERDKLEYQSSGSQLKGNPEVLSRLSHQAGSKETKVSTAKLHNTKEEYLKRQLGRKYSKILIRKSNIRKEIIEYTETTLRPGKQTGTLNGLPESKAVKRGTERYGQKIIRKNKTSRPQ
ncbi:MAG: hypothetical protein HQ522_08195 [Bacteroidetes bacterium]|nr:hypothetical protein [Bacteroidota bacterium]